MSKLLKYAFITGCTPNYIPILYAFVNSFLEHHPDGQTEIIIAGCQLPELNFPNRVKILNLPVGDPVQETAIRRFQLAVDHVRNYHAICLIDVDTFFTANCNEFFYLAEKGFIVTGSNGMLINFDAAYQTKYEIDLGVKAFVYDKIHTTSPIFLSAKDIDWFERLLENRAAPYFDDFTYLNILGVKLNKHKKMISYPPYKFTGIHHWILKPETAILEKNGCLYSGTEERIAMIHGKWHDDAWCQDQIRTMENYLKDWNMGDYCHRRFTDAFNLCVREFKKYASPVYV